MWYMGSSGMHAGHRTRLDSPKKSRIVVALAAVAAALMGTCAVGVPAASASQNETVIITSTGSLDPVQLVQQAGGTILTQFHLIDGVEAVVTTTVAQSLALLPGIVVTPDISFAVQSAPESTGPHTPSDAFLAETGADRLAASGDTGQGVTVAVLDTGIDNLPDFAGRLIGGVDFTRAGNPFADSYGHGTFVAGLIAGNGASSNGQFSGEAPGANLVSIKVAGADGSTTLGTLISGLQWAVDHQRAYGIGVLNISMGFRPSTSTVRNPVDQAVEAVWNHGIAVVVSAGNAGPFNGTVLSPGDDPLAITAGALDDMATSSPADDEMTDFSSAGPTTPDGWVKPDLVAPGRSVVSLAAPGSTIYTSYPSARVGTANFAGSGTSFSAAITSGAAALVLAGNPGLSPDQLKARLIGNTGPGPVGNPFVDGHGALDAYAAATSGGMDLSQSSGDLKAPKNGSTVSLAPTGPVDTWNTGLWSGTSWNQSPNNGWAWNGLGWNGSDWNGWAWNGCGLPLLDSCTWNGWAWNGAQWSSSWSGSAWDGTAWNGSVWNGAAWGSVDTNGRAWNGG
jgi:serine protease AprX